MKRASTVEEVDGMLADYTLEGDAFNDSESTIDDLIPLKPVCYKKNKEKKENKEKRKKEKEKKEKVLIIINLGRRGS